MKKKGFTFVEVLVALAVISALLGYVFNIMNRSFKFGQVEVKTLNALQEMTFIVNHIRRDVHSLIEDPKDEKTYIKFDPAKKSLEFTIVSGIASNGFQVTSKMSYFIDSGNCLCKNSYSVDENGKMENSVKRLAAQGHITKFYAEVLDKTGEPVKIPRERGKHPAMLRIGICNSENKRLDTYLNIYLTYMKDYDDELDMCRLPGWKIKTVNQGELAVKTATGIQIINPSANYYNLNFNLMKLGANMGNPIPFQRSIIDLGKPFKGGVIGNPDPYADPPPPAPAGGGGGGIPSQP